MLKNIILLLIVFYALSLRAESSLRDTCENAYYATGYVKLHEYRLVVDWSKVSDHGLSELEEILYGDSFVVTAQKDIQNTSRTVFAIKEKGSFDGVHYQFLLNDLSRLSFGGVSCLYNL